MARWLCVPAAVLALLHALPVPAQETLGLRQAVEEALSHNRSLQAAQAGVREADARVSQARSAYFPKISFVEGWQRGDQPVFVFSSLLSSRKFGAANFAIDALNAPDPVGLFRGAVSFEQVVFDGGRTGAAVDAAGLQRDIAGLASDDRAAAVAVAVTETYGHVLTARAARLAADAAVTSATEDLARAKARRDAGTLTDADVLAVAVHLSDVRQRQIQADGDEGVAKAELNRLLGRPIDSQYDVQDLTAPASAYREGAALPALFAEADAARPDLQRADAAERLAGAGQRQARSSWYPQIALQGGVEANGTRFGDRASSWIVGGEARWTISAGGAERAARTAAAESVARARLDRDDARQAAHVDVTSALRRLDAAVAREEVGRATAEYARESQRIVRDRFEAGLAGTSDLLRAAASALDADTQRAAARVDVVVSRARLDRALGRAPLSWRVFP